MDVYCGRLLWEFTTGGYQPKEFSRGGYQRSLLQEVTMGGYHRSLPLVVVDNLRPLNVHHCLSKVNIGCP